MFWRKGAIGTQFYFCTEIYISVLRNTLLYCCIHIFYCTEEWIRLFCSLCFCTKRLIFFCTGGVICVFKNWRYLFCSGVYIFVLKLTFLYWDTYCCTVVYFIVLIFLHAQPINVFVYWDIECSNTIYICVLPLWATVNNRPCHGLRRHLDE